MDHIKTFEEKNWAQDLVKALGNKNGQKITKSEIDREINLKIKDNEERVSSDLFKHVIKMRDQLEDLLLHRKEVDEIISRGNVEWLVDSISEAASGVDGVYDFLSKSDTI